MIIHRRIINPNDEKINVNEEEFRIIVLKSKKAFANLKFIESKAVAPNSKYYISKENRDQRARETFFKSRKNFKRVKGELTIISILDEENKANDPRLYQI